MVSCIITTYNRADLIERAINSVRKQTYEDIEIIVVDDGSTDFTSEIVRNINDCRLIYVYQENQGAQAARNKGIALAKGDYIALLDSDDMWKTNKIEVQLSKLKETDADIVISRFVRYSDDRCYFIPKWSYEGWVTEAMLGNSLFATTGTIFGKRNCVTDVKFDMNVSRFQDFDFIATAFNKYKIYFCNVPLLEQYETEGSITNDINVDKIAKTIEYLCCKHKYIPNLKKMLYKVKLKLVIKNRREWKDTWAEYCRVDDSWFVVILKFLTKFISLRLMYNVLHIFNIIRLKFFYRL